MTSKKHPAIDPRTIQRIQRMFCDARDPDRIPMVLDSIRKIWERHPDLRLGQLIVNAVRPQSPCPEIFNIEDADLLAGLGNFDKLPPFNK